MPVNVLRVADRVAGNAIERLTNDHHARRLGKLGRSAQRTPPDDGRLWAAGDPPPRAGNALDVLIEGAAYFPALEQAIRCARRSVLIAGWCITPGFALVRDEPPVLLRELLGEAAESVDVRVLLWAGAPVPVFAPRRASVREGRDELVRGTRIKAALDSNERPMHCHHEKLVVIDDEVAFVGGIDLTDLSGDRYDTPEHPARGRTGWHDVASRLRGPAVADVGRHVAQRWQAVTGERLENQPADVPGAGDVELQIVRTLPEKLYDFAPRGDFRIIEAYLRALRSAQHLVYLENQFLWSPEIVNILADKLRRPPADEFRVVIMLDLVCDLTIAADNAEFGQTGPRVGSFDGGFGASLLARNIGVKRAKEVWFLCRLYSAEEALAMGLVNTVVPLAELERETVAWCREMTQLSPLSLRLLKSSFNAEEDGLTGLQQLSHDATLLFYMTEEGKEGRDAYQQGRRPDFSKYPRRP